MQTSFLVCLRDLSKKEAQFLAEEEFRADDEEAVGAGDPDAEITGCFERFVDAVRVLPPLSEGDIDVYIGLWGGQATFEIPSSFFQLIAGKGWKVTFDLND